MFDMPLLEDIASDSLQLYDEIILPVADQKKLALDQTIVVVVHYQEEQTGRMKLVEHGRWCSGHQGTVCQLVFHKGVISPRRNDAMSKGGEIGAI